MDAPLIMRCAKRKIMVRTAICAAGLFGGAVLAELVLRVAAPQPPSWLDIYRRHPELPTFTNQANVKRLVDTGETRWLIHTDENGFRFAGQDKADPQAPLALVLGDSFTFGNGVNDEQTFVGLLNSRCGDRFRFINAGVGGYGLVQYRQNLEYLLRRGIAPQTVIVVTYMGNDFFDCVWSKDLPVVNGILGNRKSVKSLIKRNSHLYRLASRVWHRVRRGQPRSLAMMQRLYDAPSWEAPPLKDAAVVFREELGRIRQICSERGIQLSACIIPTHDAVADLNDGRDYDRPSRIAAEMLRDVGIAYVDATAALQLASADQTYFRHDRHLTPAGHEVVQKVIAESCLSTEVLTKTAAR